eukprot:352083_1
MSIHCLNFWLTLFDKLKRFSFIVESGSNSKEIQEFEHKCRILFKYETFEMEHDLRVSLMLCNSMKIPPIFIEQQSIESQSMILPLHKWKHFSTELNEINICIKPQGWSKDKITVYKNCTESDIFKCLDSKGSDYKFMFKIGGFYQSQDRHELDIFVNMRTCELIQRNWIHFPEETEDTFSGQWDSHDYEKFASFQHFLELKSVQHVEEVWYGFHGYV